MIFLCVSLLPRSVILGTQGFLNSHSPYKYVPKSQSLPPLTTPSLPLAPCSGSSTAPGMPYALGLFSRLMSWLSLSSHISGDASHSMLWWRLEETTIISAWSSAWAHGLWPCTHLSHNHGGPWPGPVLNIESSTPRCWVLYLCLGICSCSGSWVSKRLHRSSVRERHSFSGPVTFCRVHQEICGQDITNPFLS